MVYIHCKQVHDKQHGRMTIMLTLTEKKKSYLERKLSCTHKHIELQEESHNIYQVLKAMSAHIKFSSSLDELKYQNNLENAQQGNYCTHVFFLKTFLQGISIQLINNWRNFTKIADGEQWIYLTRDLTLKQYWGLVFSKKYPQDL